MTIPEDVAGASPPLQNLRLAQGFEVLAAKLSARDERRQPDYEVVIIGSGYGGSVAAAELAQRLGAGVCVLERGREYLRGMFPTGLSDLPRHIRYSNEQLKPHGERSALLDFRVGPDMTVLVANGLGGGSLINAGVMLEPKRSVMKTEAWPNELRNDDLDRWFQGASERLGAAHGGDANVWPDVALPKLVAFNRLKQTQPPPLTMAFDRKLTGANVQLEACVRCGDCATGCNHGAKESLDTNLLVKAKNNGADIYSGATVLRIERDASGWTIVVTHTDEKLRRRQEPALRLLASRVVLAAGTLGTTEILLRSRQSGLALSTRLGERFSGNGDMLAALSDLKDPARAVADERCAPNRRDVGPTITGMIDEREASDEDKRLVIQDLTVPSALRRLFEEGTALSKAFDMLVRGDTATYRHSGEACDPCAIDRDSTDRSLTVALIGHDTADGTIQLNGEPEDWVNDADTFGDGAVQIRWPQARADRRLDIRQARLADLHRAAKLGGQTLANPMWRLLPPQLEFLFVAQRGPLLTVHPLGGCVMANDVHGGVVDHLGRVYDPSGTNGSWHEGLVILDGSIVPSSLGINPALTIAALALRAVTGLLQTDRAWSLPEPRPAADPPTTRRVFKRVAVHEPAVTDPVPTTVEMIERMTGCVRTAGYAEPLHVELTLQFEPQDITALSGSMAESRRIRTGAGSVLRLFTDRVWQEAQALPDDDIPDDLALSIVPIEAGSLTIFTQAPSSACLRRARAAVPWLLNRGVRDIVQDVQARLRPTFARWKLRWNDSPQLPGREPPCDVRTLLSDVWQRVKSTWSLLSLAGEVRRFEYDLTLGEPLRKPRAMRAIKRHAKLRANKQLTYNHRANPWRQLLEAEVTEGPFIDPQHGQLKLELDLRYLERRATPLFRLLEQQDQTAALVDVASFLLYVLRVLLRVHTWSFRKPDVGPPRLIDRFPRLDGVAAQIFEIDTTGRAGPETRIRLTRFPPYAAHRDPASARLQDTGRGQPVLMIHGYSVSGTTFAHPAAPSLAKYLSDRGYDAWVVDLRTSAALETARLPWTFEEVAYADIPVAVEYIVQHTGFPQVDIIAHCMGSAMVCMALLEQANAPDYRDHTPVPDPFPAERARLKQRIRRLVLSQVTPVTLFTPNNLFRAFVLRYVRQYLNLEQYSFHIEGPQSLADQLLDRFLTTLPYPKSEFDRENPPITRLFHRTPWTTTRHRMDALYGRDFSLKNVSDETLEHIDDFFGPLNIQTVSQAIHFARFRLLTDRTGFNRYVTLTRLGEQLGDIPVLSLHADENGLVDVATENYLRDRWSDAGLSPNKKVPGEPCDHLTERIRGYGHQDCFIGVHAERDVFTRIVSFLERKDFPCPPQD